MVILGGREVDVKVSLKNVGSLAMTSIMEK